MFAVKRFAQLRDGGRILPKANRALPSTWLFSSWYALTKIQSPKSEIPNKLKIENQNIQKIRLFGFVWSFDIRVLRFISEFRVGFLDHVTGLGRVSPAT
jgi:hypothetical protein